MGASITLQRLPLLDGLRGIAAIGVMLFHAEIAFDSFGPFSRSYLFVDLFFLLSGFVLTLSAEDRLTSGQLSAAAFMRGRIIRLWPTVAMGIAVGALFAWAAGDVRDISLLIALGLLMAPLVGRGEIFPLNGPQWSILMELIANLAHALILHRLRTGWLLAFIGAAGLALAVTVSVYGSNTLGPRDVSWWLALPRVGFSYGMGIWLARHWVSGQSRRSGSWQVALALPAVAVVVINALPVGVAVGDLIAVAVLWPAIIWLTITARAPASIGPWLRRLGTLSFPLYAVHLPILHGFTKIGLSAPIMALAICATILAAGALSLILAPSALRQRFQRLQSALPA